MGQTQQEKQSYRDISLKEKVTQSPFQLYRKYGKFPWQFLIHVLLVIFTTYQFSTLIALRNNYITQQTAVFRHVLVSEFKELEDEYTQHTQIQKLQILHNHFKSLGQNLVGIDGQLLLYSDSSQAQYQFEVWYIDIEKATQQHIFQISHQELKDGSTAADSSSCLIWDINIYYDYSSYSSVKISMDIEPGFCRGDVCIKCGKTTELINYFTLSKRERNNNCNTRKKMSKFQQGKKLGTIAQNVKFEEFENQADSSDEGNSDQELESYDKDNEQQRINHLFQYKRDFSKLSFREKLVFFDIWILLGAFSNVAQMIGTIQTIIDLTTPLKFQAPLEQDIIGIGAAVSWIIMLYYLKFNPNILGFMNALQISGSNIFLVFFGSYSIFLWVCIPI